jgi:hypothetical protein
MPTHPADDMTPEYDFSQGKRGLVIPQPSKTPMSLWVDTDVYEAYMAYTARLCWDVAPEMNLALHQYIETLWAQTVAQGREA